MTYLEWSSGRGKTFRLGSEVPSDMDGTIELEAPMPLRCPLPLSDGKEPVASLLDARQEQGFVGVQGRCVHVPDGPFDVRLPKRGLQSVICPIESWRGTSCSQRGHRTFRETHRTRGYRLLLHSMWPIPHQESVSRFCRPCRQES